MVLSQPGGDGPAERTIIGCEPEQQTALDAVGVIADDRKANLPTAAHQRWNQNVRVEREHIAMEPDRARRGGRLPDALDGKRHLAQIAHGDRLPAQPLGLGRLTRLLYQAFRNRAPMDEHQCFARR